jgi:hypothetical protein
MKFQRLPPCFRGRETQWRYREGSIFKPEVRNSRWQRQTGCTYISASKQDSEEIPTGICIFLGSGKSIVLSQRLCLETGSQKFKMAAAKTGSTCISASIQDSKEILTVNCMFLGSGNLKLLHIGTGSQKFKMAPAKPEVHVFQLLCKIAKKFQWLSAYFWGRASQWRYLEDSISKPEVRNSIRGTEPQVPVSQLLYKIAKKS